MKDTYIHYTARTAMGKRGGQFRNVDAVELSAAVLKELACNPDEIIWGAVQQYGEQGYNVGRQAALKAGIPNKVPAITVNRLCGSSMSAVHQAYCNIQAGMAETVICGGVEHMTHNPMTEHYVAPKQLTDMAQASALMGVTAEFVAALNGISREAADDWAANSQYAAAINSRNDINVHVMGHDPDGALKKCDYDETIRETTLEKLGKLPPAFGGKNVTAGNSSAIADGASGVIVSSEKQGARARIVGIGVSAGDPSTMGIQPVYAVEKALQMAGISKDDVGAWEINEAFAAQVLAVIQDLDIDFRLVNNWGGAIAMGHPLGASGTRIIHTLIRRMHSGARKYGVATMCVGMGQGVAIVLEDVC